MARLVQHTDRRWPKKKTLTCPFFCPPIPVSPRDVTDVQLIFKALILNKIAYGRVKGRNKKGRRPEDKMNSEDKGQRYGREIQKT